MIPRIVGSLIGLAAIIGGAYEAVPVLRERLNSPGGRFEPVEEFALAVRQPVVFAEKRTPPVKGKRIPQSAAPKPRQASSGASSPSSPSFPQSPSVASVAAETDVAVCHFVSGNTVNHSPVRLNEIAWMGSSGSLGADGEWVELANTSSETVNLEGWSLFDQGEQIEIRFGNGDRIQANGLYLLERKSDEAVPAVPADKIYTGSLANEKEGIRLFGPSCVLADEAFANPAWPAGENSTKKTMERNVGNLDWHTSILAGGTPRAENSVPPPPSSPPPPAPTPVPPAPPAPPQLSTVTITSDDPDAGEPNDAGSFTVSRSGSDISQSLVVTLAIGGTAGNGVDYVTLATIVIIPADLSSASVSVSPIDDTIVEGSETVTIALENGPYTVGSSNSITITIADDDNNPPPPPPASNANHILISEIQTSGGPGHTTDDFIEIYNPLDQPFNLNGHRLVKRSANSSSDTLLKSWTSDAFVPAHGFYLWANSGFTAIVLPPDAATSGSIADDNGIAIRQGPNDTGTVIDSVAWGTSANGFGEGTLLPNFNPLESFERKAWNGSCTSAYGSGELLGNGCDTDSNSADFEVRASPLPQSTTSSVEP